MRHGVAERAVMAAALRGKYARLLRCVRQIPAARVVFRKKCRNERIARAHRINAGTWKRRDFRQSVPISHLCSRPCSSR